ncbi:MAG: right-handed parallel beta-helix repeat-containing protein [Methanobrevibacter sp.]|nr:right-handed parallel beta-helix repeat-containing protein [Methanobrevibacter sp.]
MNDTTLMKTSNEISSSLSSDGGVDKLGATEDEEILKADWVVSGNTFGDIQTAINNAGNGDTIYLGGKTFTASSSTITVNKTVTICGGTIANPNTVSTLNGNGNGHAIFTLSASGIVLTNINFINGNHGNDQTAGAIEVQSSNCTISNSTFVNCAGARGGAIYSASSASNLKIDYCNFTDNRGDWGKNVGDVYLEGSNGEINNCNFKGGSFGAIYATSGVNISNSNIENYNSGSVAIVDLRGTSNINNVNFTNNRNTAWDSGCALSIAGANSRVSNSKFERNTAQSKGGAIYNTAQGTQIENCNFTENSVLNSNGGAVHSKGAGLTVSECIFEGNTAPGTGNDIYSDGANSVIEESGFGGSLDLGVSRGSDSLIFTLTGNFGNAISGSATLNNLYYWDGETKSQVTITSGTNFVVIDKNISVEVSDSQGTIIDSYSDLTDQNGQITYDYSNVPFGDYTYKAYPTDDESIVKEGPLYNFVTGNTFTDIQNAIDATPSGGTVYLKGITYTNDRHANMVINKPITIVGMDGTVLDAQQYSRIFNINEGVSNVELANITFINGLLEHQSGAAVNINLNCENISISGSNFTNNQITGYEDGGAIYSHGDNTKITNCNFDSNSASNGGAIDLEGSGATVDGCNFTQNTATHGNGGAVYVNDNDASISNCEMTGNTASFGGAIAIGSECYNDEIVNVTFNGNTANQGSAIYSDGENAKVSDSTFAGSSDLSVVGGSNKLTITLSADLGNAIGGSIEKENLYYWDGESKIPINSSESNIFPLANRNVTVEIYDSNGNLVNNTTALTDENGQIIYDYSYLPIADYNYTVYCPDNPSLMKKGKLYSFVSGNFSGIQAAINAASPGDTLYLVDDVYYNDISGNMVINKPLTFIGVDGTVLNAEGLSGIFTVNNVNNVNFENIKFINGNNTDYGGAIDIQGSSNGAVTNCTFVNNTANIGGGAVRVDNNAAGWNFYNSTFINNTALSLGDDAGRAVPNGGGAIWSCVQEVSVYNSSFRGNKGSFGGALRGSFNTYDSKFIENVAFNGNGGAIDVTIDDIVNPRPTLRYENSTFINNTAIGSRADIRAQGGALHMYNIQHVDIVDSKFYNNTADRGGAIDLYIINTVNVDNSIIENNTAISEGGGLFINSTDTPSRFTNSNISNNRAGTDGGAICLFANGAYFENITSVNNTASRGGSSFVRGANTQILNSRFNNNSAIYNGTEASGLGGALDLLGDNTYIKNINSSDNNASRGGSTFIRGENTVILDSKFENNKLPFTVEVLMF